MKFIVNNTDSDFYVKVVTKAIIHRATKVKVVVYQEKNIVEGKILSEMLVNTVDDAYYQFI